MILSFPEKKMKKKISSKDIEKINFITFDDREIWIDDPYDIVILMKFIMEKKIVPKERWNDPAC